MTLHSRWLVGVVFIAACGDDAGPVADPPDGPPPSGVDIRVEIHRSFPFVEGNTVDEAAFVAVQDGDGPFVEVTGTNGVYTVHIENARFGVAVGCNDSTAAFPFTGIEIAQRTIEDDLVYKAACKQRPTDATLAVAVSGMAAGERLRLRTRRTSTNASSDGTVAIGVDTGPNELFGALTDANRNVLRMFREPSIQVSGTTNFALDVVNDGAPPDRTGTFTISPDDPTASLSLFVDRPYGRVSVLVGSSVGQIGTNRNYVMLPQSQRETDDLYRFSMGNTSGSVSVTKKSPGNLAFTMPVKFSAAPPELVTSPFLHPVWTVSPTAPVLPNQSYSFDVSNVLAVSAPIFRFWSVSLSSRWVGGRTTRYEFPDLTAMTGFADLALVPHERLDTTITRLEFTTQNLSDPGVDGTEVTSSSATATIGEFCGDGIVQNAFETCDPGSDGETSICDVDCTAATCGDNVTNVLAGEQCDPPDGTTCDANCQTL